MAQLFVCDAACVQEFGHNVVALKYFAEAFARSGFSKVVPLCCKYLPESLARLNGFVPYFRFYYEGYLHLPAGTNTWNDVSAPASLPSCKRCARARRRW